MFWKTQNGRDYLIRTTTRGGQKSLGTRSEQTEIIYKEFTVRKQRLEKRVSDLSNALELHRKLNKVFRVGRSPEILVAILNQLAVSGIADYFTVIGTQSLYAYAAAAGVRLEIGEAEIRDFDVDVIHRKAKEGQAHSLKLTDQGDETFVAQAEKIGILSDGERFTAMIVSGTGRMARMHTFSPIVFSKFKRWIATQDNRDPIKRQRDILQAELVEEMVSEFFPNLR